MECILKLFLCLSKCGLRDCLIKQVAFLPPKEKYTLEPDVARIYGDSKLIQTFKMRRLKTPKQKQGNVYEYLPSHKNLETHVFCIGQNQIPAIFCRNLQSKKNKILLCSHGNSTDLSQYYDFLCELSQELDCDTFCYEYPGYGPTPGKLSDKYIIENIEFAYDFITSTLEYSWQNIVLYSHSLGSGPSIFLASQNQKPIGGMILNSPLSSGLKLLLPNNTITAKEDFFPNFQMIKFVNCPVFIMHGEKDDIIPIKHGKYLYKKLKQNSKYNPWWVKDANHNDIQYNNRQEFFERISNFLKYCSNYSLNKTEKDMRADEWGDKFNHLYADWKQDKKNVNQRRIVKSQSVISASQFNTTAKDDQKSQKYQYEDENIPPISNKNKSEITLSNCNIKNSEKMKKKDLKSEIAQYQQQYSEILKKGDPELQSSQFKIKKIQ
ncbi:hypothetical protein ABPG72_019600 [Tetrahymena utriculariae]